MRRELRRAVRCVVCWAAALGPAVLCPAQGFDYVLHTSLVPYPSPPPARPAKGQCWTDPDFHTTFCRVADVVADGVTVAGQTQMAAPVYSRFTPLSSGGHYLYLQRAVGNPDGLLYDPVAPYPLIKVLPDSITIDGVPGQTFVSMESAEIRWDRSGAHPHRFDYVGEEEPRLYRYDVLTDSAQLVHDFSAEIPAAVVIGNGVEGDSSDDSRYWAFMVRGAYDPGLGAYPLLAIVTYDRQTDQVLGTLDLAAYQAHGGAYPQLPEPNMVEVAPSGGRVIVHVGRCYDNGGGEAVRPLDVGTVFDGPHAWDLDFTDPVKVSVDETHSGWAWGLNGSELFVSQNNRTDWIEAVDVRSGEVWQVLAHEDLGWGNGWHFARMPRRTPGWVLMSTYAETPNVDWGDNQLLMLEVRPAAQSPRVWRLGHTHNTWDEYYAEAFAAMSQHGDRLWWGAKWPGQSAIEAYEMTLPASWASDLNGGLVFGDGFEVGSAWAWTAAN